MPRHYFNPDSPRVSILLIREDFDSSSLGILHSIQYNSYANYEVVVVNIGADEKDVMDLYKVFPNIKQVSLKINVEKEYALSEGLKMAKGEFLLFLNGIEEINENFIELLVNTTKKNRRIAIVSPQVRSFHHKELNLFSAPEQPKGMGNYLDFSNYNAVQTKTEDETPRYSHFACNDAFLVSMEFLHQIEDKEKGSFFFLDEIDIAETVFENRYKIYFEPQAVAYLDDDKDEENSKSIYYKTRNRLASIRKHKQGFMLIGMILLFCISSIPRHTFQHLLHLRLDHMFAFYRGVVWNVVHSVKAGGFFSYFKWKSPIN